MTSPLEKLLTELEAVEAGALPGVRAEIYVEDEGIYLAWQNPFTGQSERIATFFWPGHPPEATEQVEQWFENLAQFITRFRNVAKTLIEIIKVQDKALEHQKASDNEVGAETSFARTAIAAANSLAEKAMK